MSQEEQIARAVHSILMAVGDDPQREGLRLTPQRVAHMYGELLDGMGKDPEEALSTVFEEDTQNGLVILKAIPFFSICEHHLLPFYGRADIGYVPNGRVAGASKLARALDILAHRLQLQERLTTSLADAVFRALSPRGVGVVISAEHLCMIVRGVKKPGSAVVTTAYRGDFPQEEFLALVQRS